MRTLILLLLLMPINSFSADLGFMKLGSGLDSNNWFSTKILSVGYQSHLIGLFDYQLETGMFNDLYQPQGLIGFVGASVGVHVDTSSGFYAKLFFGPSAVTQTDTRLSSIFEFNDDIEVGLKDARGVSVGINFKHLSNAGFVLPNLGRDFLILQLQLPF